MATLIDTPRGVSGKINRNSTAQEQQAQATGTLPAITSQSLVPTQSIIPEQPKPSTAAEGLSAQVGAGAENYLAGYQQMQAQNQRTLGNLEKEIFKSLSGPGEISLTDQAYKEQGVDQTQTELRDINQKILESQRAQKAEVEALGKNGALTPAQYNAQVQGINRKYVSEQADLAVIQLAKQGKYSDAKAIADRAVSAMLEGQRNRLSALQFTYERYSNLFDKQETRAFQTAQAERERQLDNEEYRLRAEFDNKIKQSDPLYQAQLTKARADAANASALSLGGTLNGKPQTTAQSTIEGYANRTLEADSIISKVGSNFTGFGSYIGQALPSPFKGQDRRQYEQAQRNFVNAVLRRESGAVISDEEFANARQQYFPQPGDGPEVVAQKAQNRQTVISNLYQTANKVMPATAGSIIEDADGTRYLVGQDGETLEPL